MTTSLSSRIARPPAPSPIAELRTVSFSSSLRPTDAAMYTRPGPRGSEPRALDGGITKRNYRVVMGGEDYVLRICGKDTAVLGIDRDAECEATVAAARLGVGPEVALYRPDLEVLVTRWVEGRP